MADDLVIAGKTFKSRLIVGTGRYRTMEDMVQAIEASGTEMVTVAIRRLDLDDPSQKTILDYIDWTKVNILPNTAGCATMEEALFVARLGSEVAKTDFVKLEVIPDARYLFPDPAATLETAKQLVAEGFIVLPYIHADPVLAKNLEEVGCATVMPLGSAIGSGQGIHTVEEIRIIIEQANVPVVVDAGLAVPSDASKALELGADAVLVNTAIAQAENPAMMPMPSSKGWKRAVAHTWRAEFRCEPRPLPAVPRQTSPSRCRPAASPGGHLARATLALSLPGY